ncbi:MAG TPA: EAL domain-containing protein [Rhodocyclaceae bacterium]|nr:EAL domain-containing protein [Rhodocyclaceae bacterium]
MSSVRDKSAFKADYESALKAYVAAGPDTEAGALDRARELGRRAIAGEQNLIELIALHWGIERALEARAGDSSDAAARCQRFLAQTLNLFEMARRQSVELNLSLRNSKRRKAAILGGAFDGIITLDMNGRIVDFNPAAERIFKLHRHQARGCDMADLLLLPSQRAGFRQTLEHHRRCGNGASIGGRLERRALTPDGREFPVEIAVTYIEVDEAPFYAAYVRDLSELKAYQDKIEYLATRDALTGLANRNLFKDRLSQAIAQAARSQANGMGVLFLGVDRLKFINDSMGHAFGDELIRTVAARLKQSLHTGDTLARLSSDDFAMIMVGLKNPAEALMSMAGELLAVFMPSFQVDGHSIRLSCSIGAAVYPEDGTDVGTLMSNADAAMHRAKSTGGGRFQFYTRSLSDLATERVNMENALWGGLERDEFCLYYQPQVSVRDGAIVGAEALVRWRHPELGMVQPGRFIGLAEETGLIGPIGEWVLETATEQNRQWHRRGFTSLRMAVNVSPRQFRQGAILETLKTVAGSHPFDSGFLELEVTEGTMMEDMYESIRILNELRTLGASISIDDFGTGYSSLNHLRHLPVDRLKIDQSFIHEMEADAKARTMVTEIIHLSKAFDLSIIAEGVETQGELAFLADHGCDEGQGYLFARPLPPAEFEHLLRAGPVWTKH